MKIGVDAGCLGVSNEGLKVGVYHIVKNALVELGKKDKKNSYLLYSFYPIEKSVMKSFGRNMKNVVVRPARGWMRIWLPIRLLLDKVDVFIAANQAVPLRLPGSTYRTVGIVYDIAFEKYPELYAYAASVQKHRYYTRQTAKSSDIVIAISQKTKEDLVEVYGLPGDKILVAYPGIVSLPRVKPHNLGAGYFLYVGAFKKGKNIPTLLEAYMEFRKKSKKRLLLLMAGGTMWMDPEIKKILEKIPTYIKNDIHLLGAITNPKKLSALYRGAIAFVCPSLYEGFGMPFVEAMSVGCPVIASDRGSIPEVVGKGGILTDAYNVSGITKAMRRIVENKKLRLGLGNLGKKQSKRYSFKMFAKAIYSGVENEHEKYF